MLKRDKPLAQLMPNFDYKIAQFNDFYDLETNNFDESQQALAQHLIGYQSRDYLENLNESKSRDKKIDKAKKKINKFHSCYIWIIS